MSQMKKIPFNISGVYSSSVHDKLMDYGASTPDEGGMSWVPSTHFSLPCFDLKKSPNEQSNDPQMSREEYNKLHSFVTFGDVYVPEEDYENTVEWFDAVRKNYRMDMKPNDIKDYLIIPYEKDNPGYIYALDTGEYGPNSGNPMNQFSHASTLHDSIKAIDQLDQDLQAELQEQLNAKAEKAKTLSTQEVNDYQDTLNKALNQRPNDFDSQHRIQEQLNVKTEKAKTLSTQEVNHYQDTLNKALKKDTKDFDLGY